MGSFFDSRKADFVHMHEPPYDRDIYVYTSPFCERKSEAFAFGMTRIPPHNVHEVHAHSSEEVLYVLSGQGKGECGGVEFAVYKGMVIQCQAEENHGFVNTGDEPLELLWIASPPGREQAFIPKQSD